MNAERFAGVKCPVGVKCPILSALGVTSVSDVSVSGDQVPDDSVSDDRVLAPFGERKPLPSAGPGSAGRCQASHRERESPPVI